MLCLQCGIFNQQIRPVRIGIKNWITMCTETFQHCICKHQFVFSNTVTQLGSIICHSIVVTVSKLRNIGRHLKTGTGGESYFSFTGLSALRCHQDNTIGTTHTKYGCSRSIFQYGNIFHFIGVQLGERTFHSIDQT